MKCIPKHIATLFGLFLVMSFVTGTGMAQNTPVIDSVYPNAAVVQKQTLAIQGHQLAQLGHATSVTFGGVPAAAGDILLANDNLIILLVPAGASSGPLVVSVGGVASNPQSFTVIPSADHVADEVLIELFGGAHIGRVLAMTEFDLLRVQPIGARTFYGLGIGAADITQAIKELGATNLVYAAWANFIAEENDSRLPSKQDAQAPNDPLFASDQDGGIVYTEQYGPQRIHAVDSAGVTPDAHRLNVGFGQYIAIVDTGIDADHPDLTWPGGIPLPPLGAPPQTKVIDGYDWIYDDADPDDHDCSHGTHVAGIAGAVADNTKGIAGMAPRSLLIAEKVLRRYDPTKPCSGSYQAIADGILHASGQETSKPVGALGHAATVINLSLGGKAPDAGMEHAIKSAVLKGIPVVVSSGNSGGEHVRWPAAYSNKSQEGLGKDLDMANGIVTVANSTFMDGIAASSTRGLHVDVAAPGHEIVSTVPLAVSGVLYQKKTGTSMAAPHVSGLVALMLSTAEGDGIDLKPWHIECLLELTAQDIGSRRGFDKESGHGRVNAYAAVHAVKSLAGDIHLLPPECKKPPELPPKPTKTPFEVPVIRIPVPDPNPELLAIPWLLSDFPGLAFPDQVTPITSDSETALVAVTDKPYTEPAPEPVPERTIKVDLTTNALVGFPGDPVNDVVITSDDLYALVSEFDPEIDPFKGKMRRIQLSTDTNSVRSSNRPRTEITLTPNALKALVGTVEAVEVFDVPGFDALDPKLYPFLATTGISITPDSSTALVGSAAKTRLIDLVVLPDDDEVLNTGIPITGIPITGNGEYAAVGTPDGVDIIEIASRGVVPVASGVSVSNIALTPDNQKAVYATTLLKHTQGRILILDLDRAELDQFVDIPVPVTDVDVTSNSQQGIVGTVDGVSCIDIPSATKQDEPLPMEVTTGVSLSPALADEEYAAIGIENGVAVIDLATCASTIFATARPVTNISCPRDGVDNENICVLGVGVDDGVDTGIVCLDLAAKSAVFQPTPTQPSISATLSPDGEKGLIGTKARVYDLKVADCSITARWATPPVQNALPDDEQPPMNPSGERGGNGSSDG